MPEAVRIPDRDRDPVPRKRDRRQVEERFGTVVEAGRDARFVLSPNGTVHERPPLVPEDRDDDADGVQFALGPVCGQTLPPRSVWGSFDAATAREVAVRFGETSFCSRCFDRSLALERLGRAARDGAADVEVDDG